MKPFLALVGELWAGSSCSFTEKDDEAILGFGAELSGGAPSQKRTTKPFLALVGSSGAGLLLLHRKGPRSHVWLYWEALDQGLWWGSSGGETMFWSGRSGGGGEVKGLKIQETGGH